MSNGPRLRLPGPKALAIAVALLLGDALLIAGDVMRHDGVLHDRRFSLATERGYGEWAAYAKACAVALLLWRARKTAPAARVWAAFFTYALLDDAFALHERAGLLAASLLPLPAVGSIRPQQVGELLLFGAVGLAFVAALALASRHDAASRSLNRALVPAFGALVFFGVFVDVLHSWFRGGPYSYVTGVIEDGGELVAMTAIVMVAHLVTRGGRSEQERDSK